MRQGSLPIGFPARWLLDGQLIRPGLGPCGAIRCPTTQLRRQHLTRLRVWTPNKFLTSRVRCFHRSPSQASGLRHESTWRRPRGCLLPGATTPVAAFAGSGSWLLLWLGVTAGAPGSSEPSPLGCLLRLRSGIGSGCKEVLRPRQEESAGWSPASFFYSPACPHPPPTTAAHAPPGSSRPTIRWNTQAGQRAPLVPIKDR